MDEAARARYETWWAEIVAGRCTYCHQPMTCVQVGRDVHAAPCGHCLYEGQLPEAPREEDLPHA